MSRGRHKQPECNGAGADDINGLRPLFGRQLDSSNAAYLELLLGIGSTSGLHWTFARHDCATSFEEFGIVESVNVEGEVRFYVNGPTGKVGHSRKWLGRV